MCFPILLREKWHAQYHKKIRYEILKEKSIYIPIGTRACSKHIQEQAWNNIDHFRMKSYSFNKYQIADMIELLRMENDNIPGNISIRGGLSM